MWGFALECDLFLDVSLHHNLFRRNSQTVPLSSPPQYKVVTDMTTPILRRLIKLTLNYGAYILRYFSLNVRSDGDVTREPCLHQRLAGDRVLRDARVLRDERVLVSTRSGDERVDGRQALFVLPQLRAHLGVDRHVRDELAGRRRQVGVGLGQQRDDGRDGVARPRLRGHHAPLALVRRRDAHERRAGRAPPATIRIRVLY